MKFSSKTTPKTAMAKKRYVVFPTESYFPQNTTMYVVDFETIWFPNA